MTMNARAIRGSGVRPFFFFGGLALASIAAVLAPPAFADRDEPLAGYAHGAFFLRSEGDDFVLIPHGRIQLDFLGFVRGEKPAARLPEDSFVLRRVRPELNGTILRFADFQLAGDWTASNSAAANNQGITDAWIALQLHKYLRLQLGQHDAPFTLENRTSDKYFDFMERSVTVRAFGVPTNKETGAWIWGLLPKEIAYYSVGVFNGFGQNWKSLDGRMDVIGRAWIAPFAMTGYAPLANATFGGSAWYGSRGAHNNALPAMSTQGGFQFFRTSYKLGNGDAVGLVPRRNQVKWAVEADVPISHKWGFRFELVHDDLGLDEVVSGVTKNTGTLKGTSWYAQAWWYLVGDDRVTPRPGLQIPHRVKPYDPVLAPSHALQLLLRYERLGFRYDNDGRQAGIADPAMGSYGLEVYELGLNYWATKHLRFSFNYALNHFSGSAGQANAADARPVSGSDWLHELMLRVAIAL